MKYIPQPNTTITIVGDALSQGTVNIEKSITGNGDVSIISKQTWSKYFEPYFESVHNLSIAGASNSRSARQIIEKLEYLSDVHVPGQKTVYDHLIVWQLSHPRNNELHNADYNFWLQYDYIQDKVFIDDRDYQLDCPPHIQKIADDALEYFRATDKCLSAKYVNNRYFETAILMQEWCASRNIRLLTITANQSRLPYEDIMHRFSTTYNWIVKRHIISDALTSDDFLGGKEELIDKEASKNHDFIMPNKMGYKYMADNVWKQLDLLNWIHKPDE